MIFQCPEKLTKYFLFRFVYLDPTSAPHGHCWRQKQKILFCFSSAPVILFPVASLGVESNIDVKVGLFKVMVVVAFAILYDNRLVCLFYLNILGRFVDSSQLRSLTSCRYIVLRSTDLVSKFAICSALEKYCSLKLPFLLKQMK